jgi:hypothetical protein
VSFPQCIFSFPLLGKELRERAARRRTYWQRAMVAALLYLTFWLANQDHLDATEIETMQVLGVGKEMFESVQIFLYLAFAASCRPCSVAW